MCSVMKVTLVIQSSVTEMPCSMKGLTCPETLVIKCPGNDAIVKRDRIEAHEFPVSPVNETREPLDT